MAISANSLIHYTRKFEFLLGILRNRGFKFSYCSEKLKTRGSKNYTAAIGMVSFCDIPISDYKKHFYNKRNTGDLGYYGDYGIGLSKKWASEKGLNPVLYIDQNSFVSHSLRKAYESLLNEAGEIIDLDDHTPILYAKNYEGELVRGSEVVHKKYRFYDEREWRLVPKTESIAMNPPIVDDKKYRFNKDGYNQRLENYLLKFELQDISYIIVKETSEIQLVYETLSSIFNRSIIDLQSITILTSEQIVGDF
ncbi:abortive infection system antitoxin AbiGi family protein [Pedobacter sp. ASV28]|uniref:abortive infection system antitoxin AbiGi family protein n=1 Tax=Pedobacter sp. ASV28 TaxID=2795123 RepID=UPI0018EBD4E2|nr:abortive infection system antitoxin AbiGi family protein [Pedobacter sp. ASV28]